MSERSYHLIARLGRGGMGVVDLARGADGNKVALKRLTLHGSASDIARSRQRLLREATVLRKLHHPNVVRLLDVIDEGDEIVLVMPYMAGGSLAERVAQHGPAPAAEVERQARRLAGALASAHRAGVVHRDIKPANVLFDDRGEPCLADFGVALSRDQTHGLTMAGMVVGTPAFMAPEQARGEAVSPATDVFSLGATLLFAATGGGPYGQGDPGLLMVRAASGRVERVPRSLPRSLRSLLRAMLEPRPERRPSAAELAGTGGGPGADGGAGAPVPNRRDRRGRRAAAALGAVVATAAVAVAGVAVARDGASRGTAGEAVAEGPATAGAGDCADLPYQPCGEPPAPHTDGASCIDDHDDYDRIAANGCEAAPDDRDGERLDERIEANIVPRDDVDTYVLELDDEIQRLCDGTIEIRLDAPRGMVLDLELRDHLGIVDRATSVGGVPAVVRLTEERCGADDRTTYDVIVRATGDARVADDYALTREGGF
ncbi:MAG TPA: serine/threonine-protein kinase [Acidimicrobiales bacterium]